MMNSDDEKKIFIVNSYDKFQDSLTKKEIIRNAMFLTSKKCFCSVRKQDKIDAYHFLVKKFIIKLIKDLENYQPPVATHIKEISI